MNRRATLTFSLLVLSLAAADAWAQPVSEPSGQKTLAATISVYVFPTEGQTPEVQSRHEAECYGWAVQTTQSDPFDLEKAAKQQQAQASAQKEAIAESGQGAGAQGAVRGAAVGALVGAIASDDVGEAAAYGTAAGVIRGRRRARKAKASAAAEVDQQTARSQQYTQEQIEGFKKAFVVCLEAKKYLVRM